MKFVIAFVALLISFVPAAAEDQPLWQSVRAGMAPAEILAIYPTAKTASDGSMSLGAQDSPVDGASIIGFSFRDSRLTKVMVGYYPAPQNIEQFYSRRKDEMTQKFGKPVDDMSKEIGKILIATCEFVVGKTHIRLNKIAGPPGFLSSVTENYEPVATAPSAQ